MTLLAYLQSQHHIARRKIVVLVQLGQILLNNSLVSNFLVPVRVGDRIAISSLQIDEWVWLIIDEPSQILLFHKPLDCVVSADDTHSTTIYHHLPDAFQHRHYIGRLDKDTTGLLVLTNNRRLVDHFQSPHNHIDKLYRVVITSPWTYSMQQYALQGRWIDMMWRVVPTPRVHDDEIHFLSFKSLLAKDNGYTLMITLDEGKKRHIRRVLKSLGLQIVSLERIAFGPRSLDRLSSGLRKVLPFDLHEIDR